MDTNIDQNLEYYKIILKSLQMDGCNKAPSLIKKNRRDYKI